MEARDRHAGSVAGSAAGRARRHPGFDPLGARALGIRLTRSRGWCIGVAIFLFAIVSFTVSSMSSSVPFHEQLRVIAHDLGLSVRPGIDMGGEWPAWRDIRTLILVVAMGCEPILGAHQWHGMEILYHTMARSGALHIPRRESRVLLERAIDHVNARLTSTAMRVQYAASAAIALVGSYLAFRAQRASYVDDADPSTWWLTSSWVLSACYLLIATLGVHVIIVQNQIGLPVIKTMVHYFRRRKVFFAADLLNTDGRWGWRSIRIVLGTAYGGLVVNLLALMTLFSGVSLTISPTLAIPVLLGFFVFWLLVMLGYILIPGMVITRSVTAFKSQEIARIRRRFVGAHQYSLEAASRIDRVNSIPSIPFLRRWGGFLYVVGTIANLSTVLGFASLLDL